jgi:hypothetical protein
MEELDDHLLMDNQVNGHYSTAVSGDSLEESFEGESLR